MSQVISLELNFFITSLLWGAFLLFVYDGLRVYRNLVRHSAFIISLEDVLFWSAGGLSVFIMIYEKNDGVIRGFSLVAIGIGMILYHYLISGWLVKGITIALQKIISIVKRIIKWIFRPLRRGLFIVSKRRKKTQKYLVNWLKKIARTVKITITRK